MKAKRIFGEKHVFSDGSIVEMIIWRLPPHTRERPHGIKYRLYYGSADSRSMVRYDNELGKGDHRHYEDVEKPYEFKNVESLVGDFMRDISKVRRAAL